MDFEQYLDLLHEDDLSPEEVFDIIESYDSDDEKEYSSVEELLADLKRE